MISPVSNTTRIYKLEKGLNKEQEDSSKAITLRLLFSNNKYNKIFTMLSKIDQKQNSNQEEGQMKENKTILTCTVIQIKRKILNLLNNN